MTRRQLTLLKPTGSLTLGNYLGALRPMAVGRHESDSFLGIADLHALTVAHDPSRLRALTAEMQSLLLACGLEGSTLFIQSQVPQHTELAYLLECTARTGELNRMIQFKEKGRGRDGTRASLYTYPTLMAADILAYRPETVPVGEDQRQHVELTRDLALRFNTTYGPVFRVPKLATSPVAARLMDLARPTHKMGKSHTDPSGILYLLDPPDVVRRKVARAVTDSDVGPGALRHDPAGKPGVTNLVEILTACAGPGATDGLATYGALKAAVTDAVVALLEPIQERYRRLVADRDTVTGVYDAGAARCREVTAPVVAEAKAAMGL